MYKLGSVSGLTFGKFKGVSTHPSINNGLMCTMVSWNNDDHFATNGDCGSIYFYFKNGLRIPFAVHNTSARVISGEAVSFGALLAATPFGKYSIVFDKRHSHVISHEFEHVRDLPVYS